MKAKAFWAMITTPFGWLGRMVSGASRNAISDGALTESPRRLMVREFFRRKLAVAALVTLAALLLFVFFGPLFVPLEVNYTDPLQANIAPNASMLSVPRELKDNILSISGFANFTVGVSRNHKLYVWGYTKDSLTGADYAEIPAELRDGNVLTASAGTDHIIAVTTDGRVIGWGNGTLGQYGEVQGDSSIVSMPETLLRDGIPNTDAIDQLVCGYQATALVVDGRLTMWGNAKALLNMRELTETADEVFAARGVGVKKVALSGFYAVALFEDGTVSGGAQLFARDSAVSSRVGRIKYFMDYLKDKRVVDIAASNSCYAFLLDDGELLVSGAAEYGETDIPVLDADERFVSVSAGSRHFVGLTDKGRAWGWGHDDGGQASIKGVPAASVFTGAKQTYLCDSDGKLTHKSGFRGYLFGTDGRGRDVFARIVHGGRMTMTVGAVAVIISSVIAMLVGSVAGYFGGWTDLLLMRVTEIFAAIPFLPFAMLLSFIIRNYPIGETARIFLIMVILGLLSWPGPARMIRAQVLSEREKEFVLAARAMGVRERLIAFRHILPNVISVVLVSMTLDFAGCLLTESSLSYLGFGVQQPQPTWGNMLNGANNSVVIRSYWWQWVFPALFLSLATVSINLIGDALRDVLDPKGRSGK